MSSPFSAVGEVPAVGMATLCLVPPVPSTLGAAQRLLGQLADCQILIPPAALGGEEQAQIVQSTGKMGKGTCFFSCSSPGSSAPPPAGGLWGPGLSPEWTWGFILVGKGRTWGGRGAWDGAGGGLSCGGDGLSRFLTAPQDLASSGTSHKPQGRFWTWLFLRPWPRSAGGSCMDEGKDE